MNINLPYEPGTEVVTTESGIKRHDRIDHYIVGKKVQVVLVLECRTAPRLSVPIELDDFLERWSKK